jgi:hypothetical protein
LDFVRDGDALLPPSFDIIALALWFFPWRFLFFGLALGEGLKISGVFGRLHRRSPRYPGRRGWSQSELARHDQEFRRAAPRAVGRRPQDYVPFDDGIDFGE